MELTGFLMELIGALLIGMELLWFLLWLLEVLEGLEERACIVLQGCAGSVVRAYFVIDTCCSNGPQDSGLRVLSGFACQAFGVGCCGTCRSIYKCGGWVL